MLEKFVAASHGLMQSNPGHIFDVVDLSLLFVRLTIQRSSLINGTRNQTKVLLRLALTPASLNKLSSS